MFSMLDRVPQKVIRILITGNLLLLVGQFDSQLQDYINWLGIIVILYAVIVLVFDSVPSLKRFQPYFKAIDQYLKEVTDKGIDQSGRVFKSSKKLSFIALHSFKRFINYLLQNIRAFYLFLQPKSKKLWKRSLQLLRQGTQDASHIIALIAMAPIRQFKEWKEIRSARLREQAAKDAEQNALRAAERSMTDNEDVVGFWARLVNYADSPVWLFLIVFEIAMMAYLYLALQRFLNAHSGFDMFLVWQGL